MSARMPRPWCVRAFRWSLVAVLAVVGPGRAAVVKDNLYGVKALSATEAWAVGNFGAIYHTTDAGKTWELRESGTKNPLFSVDFADAQHGWAVGYTAQILFTSDGGKTWKPQKNPLPSHKHLFKVEAVDAKTVWAVGDWGAIAVTRDGGQTWEDRSLGVLPVKVEESPDRVASTITEDVILYDVAFADAQHGYICGEFGTVLGTRDGGATWEQLQTGTEKTLFGLAFATAERGWVAGIDGVLLRTKDGGRLWEAQRGRTSNEALEELGFLETLKNPGLYAVRLEGRYGVVVGDTGLLLTTNDGGESWTRLELPGKSGLVWMRDVSLAPGGGGFVVGAAGFSAIVRDEHVQLPAGGEASRSANP